MKRRAGFTLIEVVVALAILGWVLGSVLSLVSQYADDRLRMQERFLGQQVAWNQLMEEYRLSRGWVAVGEAGSSEEAGEQWAGGRNWQWQLDLEEAAGEGLWRHEVQVETEGGRPAASLVAFWQRREAGP